MMRCRAAVILLAVACDIATADPAPGHYLARYPAMYVQSELQFSDRKSTFNAQGDRQDAVTPTYGDGGSFASSGLNVDFQWFFPWFETADLPFISQRLWTAKARLGYTRTQTEGPIAEYARANDLSDASGGVQDMTLEFGPVLVGSADWRTRSTTPYSLILLARGHLPTGARNADSPNNVGSNTLGVGATLGGYWHPFDRVHLDAAIHYDQWQNDSEAAFLGQSPATTGARRSAELQLALRVTPTVFASMGMDTYRQGANGYKSVRGTVNPPTPAAGMEVFIPSGQVFDRGTALTNLHAGATWFLSPRWQLSVQYTHPLSGKSGEFDQPYSQQVLRCQATLSCNPQAAGSDHVDGLGPARVFADSTIRVGLAWQLRQGDFFLGR